MPSRSLLMKVLDTREKEAKAHFTYQTAFDNYGPDGRAREATNHMRAMTAASSAEREARLLLATLRRPNVAIKGSTDYCVEAES